MNDLPEDRTAAEKALDRDLSTDPHKFGMIRNALADGVALGSTHFQVSGMAFLLAEVTVCGVELQKVDNDAGTDFLRALADEIDTRRPAHARRRGGEDRKEAFDIITRRARALEKAMGHGDGGMQS